MLENLEKFVQPFRDFLFKYHSEPMLWVAFLVIAVSVLAIGFSTLSKDK